MNIEATANRFLTPIEKFSPYIGVGASALKRMQSIKETLDAALMGNVHAPEIGEFIDNALHNPDAQYMPAAALAIIGYIVKDATSNQTITKLAQIAEKAGTGYLATSAVIDLAYFATHSPPPTYGNIGHSNEKGITATGLQFITN